MEPYLKEGYQVITWKFSRIKTGDVIAFKHGSKYFIKRVKKIQDGFYILEGDNKKDSLPISSIQKKDIIGKVVLKL